MKEAKKKVQITEQICRQAQLMRKGGANQLQVAELLGINGSTVSRIEAAGFDFKTYTENRKARREKEEARKRKTEERPKIELVYDPSIAEEYMKEQEAKQEEEQVPGQIEMDLTQAGKPEMSDKTKMMRFLAGQVDKLYMKMETINDTMNQILRVIRRE